MILFLIFIAKNKQYIKNVCIWLEYGIINLILNSGFALIGITLIMLSVAKINSIVYSINLLIHITFCMDNEIH